MGLRLLLDTHVLLWLWSGSERVGEAVRDSVTDRANTVLVSAVSGFEVAWKVRLGKLPGGEIFAGRWSDWLVETGADALSLTTTHAVRAGTLDWAHRDPFDRLLAAQAMSEGATLVSADRVMATLPGLRLLPC